MTTRKCPGCGQAIYSANTVTAWRCPICHSNIPIPKQDLEEYIKSFPRRPSASYQQVTGKLPSQPRLHAGNYIRAGIRIGLTLVTATAVVLLLTAAGKTFLTRPGHPGGEILVPGLVYLVGWIGWQLRGWWNKRKGNGDTYVKTKGNYSRCLRTR